MVDEKVFSNATDGYRDARLPPLGEAWRRGLAALDAEAKTRHGRLFHELSAGEQDGLLTAVQKGLAAHEAWRGMSAKLFFEKRAVHDIVVGLLRSSKCMERDRLWRPCSAAGLRPDGRGSP